MSDRLAEIEATRKTILSEYEFSRADDDMLMLLTSGIPWLLAVAEAAADIVRVMTPIEHPKSPTDYAYGKVTNEQWRALVATIAPLLEEAE